MFVIIVKNPRVKILMALMVIGLWVVMFAASNALFNKGLFFNITIDDCLTFSYPLRFKINNVFVGNEMASEVIETGFSLKKPLSRKLKNFRIPEGKFSFLYPSSFTLSRKDFEGSDILYHIDFEDSTTASHGFVQVWEMPYPLEDFLEASKASFAQSYKFFNTKSIQVNGIPGYYWDYSVLGNDGKYYKGSEVFLKKDERMYRISYFLPENQWNKAQSDTFQNIVNSFKVES